MAPNAALNKLGAEFLFGVCFGVVGHGNRFNEIIDFENVCVADERKNVFELLGCRGEVRGRG